MGRQTEVFALDQKLDAQSPHLMPSPSPTAEKESACRLIGLCQFHSIDRFRGRLIEIGRVAKKTIAIATAYPTRSAAIITPMTFSPLGNDSRWQRRTLWPRAQSELLALVFDVPRVTAPSLPELYKG